MGATVCSFIFVGFKAEDKLPEYFRDLLNQGYAIAFDERILAPAKVKFAECGDYIKKV